LQVGSVRSRLENTHCERGVFRRTTARECQAPVARRIQVVDWGSFQESEMAPMASASMRPRRRNVEEDVRLIIFADGTIVTTGQRYSLH
jgi:hypothetical protein